ncbi:hypothetical protein NMD1_02834 [Novosphingobium sp. MD-1]|nr:hypothetical protein NMD1_02834 [Novosphingobium sp. MD-1]
MAKTGLRGHYVASRACRYRRTRHGRGKRPIAQGRRRA